MRLPMQVYSLAKSGDKAAQAFKNQYGDVEGEYQNDMWEEFKKQFEQAQQNPDIMSEALDQDFDKELTSEQAKAQDVIKGYGDKYGTMDLIGNIDDEEYTGMEPGGIKGDLERAGFENVEVVDDKTLTFEGPDTKIWTVKENENLGFDVYNADGKKVIEDINANKENVATRILQREQSPMKDFDELNDEGSENNYDKEIFENYDEEVEDFDVDDLNEKERELNSLYDKAHSKEEKNEYLKQLNKVIDKRNNLSSNEFKGEKNSQGGAKFDGKVEQDFEWKEEIESPKTQVAKETWPPQDLKKYIEKTDDGYSFDMNIFKDKSLDEIMMLSGHPDFKENTIIHNAVMSALYQKLKEQQDIVQEGSPRDEFNKKNK